MIKELHVRLIALQSPDSKRHFTIAGTADDYKLLETMNRTTVHKYVEMKQIAVNINRAMKDLDDKCKDFKLNSNN